MFHFLCRMMPESCLISCGVLISLHYPSLEVLDSGFSNMD